MPDWGKYIGANRLATVNNIGTVKSPQFSRNVSPRHEQQQRNGPNQWDTNTRTLSNPLHMLIEGVCSQSQPNVDKMQNLSKKQALSTPEVTQKLPSICNGLPSQYADNFEQNTRSITDPSALNNEPPKYISTNKNRNGPNTSDETVLKSIACDALNPNITVHETTPARGLPRGSLSLTRAGLWQAVRRIIPRN
ncbi:hypothetical protein DPMN_155275 [Dreissena polymorpha]|uniref:Uncharacterized protein n=1 Tax=Dreissena polymorpha TaxID=45954 RepID=A0A9D4JAR4_DREPO|nr:hypothetical protein DPMN_155275 [Dreissena polymorpha]